MYDNGVLQRDISPANLLSVLCHGSQGQQPAGLHGCLIDLDHAKRIQPISDRRNPVPTPPDADVDLLRGFFRSRFMGLDFTVDDSVIRRALALANVTLDDEALTPPTVRAYINATCGYNKRYNNGPVSTVYTATSLGWEVPILVCDTKRLVVRELLITLLERPLSARNSSRDGDRERTTIREFYSFDWLRVVPRMPTGHATLR